MPDLTDADLARLEALCQASSVDPIVNFHGDDQAWWIASREMLPRLLAEVRRLRHAVREAAQWIEAGCDHFENDQAIVQWLREQIIDA